MRKLATIRRISAINQIPGADAIEAATVDGWTVVTKKGEYAVGDLAVYLEIDSWVPNELAPFLSKGKEPREYNGVKGERLRTVKLRGQLSQGLLLPATSLYAEGDDVTEFLGIQKWERPIPAQLAGIMRGSFPSAVPKTDQERAQNLVEEIAAAHAAGTLFEVTEKLEGSSCTFFLDDKGEFHVCSRNIDLKEEEGNAFWRAARKYNVEQKMRVHSLINVAIQGELIGPNIQSNIYGLSDIEFYVFDIYSANAGEYLMPGPRQGIAAVLELPHVPVLAMGKDLGTGEVPYLLELADGKSELGVKPNREGLVWKEMNGGMTFKTISNAYLLSSKE